MVVMGDYIEVLAWEAWALLGAGGVVLWLVFRRKFQPIANKRDYRAADPSNRVQLRE